MATAREENPFEGGGLGTGGKFRKRPFRRTQTTPYDRPPTALRNARSNNGWLSKLVDPAQRLITSSAHRLFSSVFRKRLPAPSLPQSYSPEADEEARDNQQEAIALDTDGKQEAVIGQSEKQSITSDRGGLTELEQLLKQKTFTRSEIDRLTALLHSRTVDSPIGEEEKRDEVIRSKPMMSHDQKEKLPKTPSLKSGIESHLISTPYISSSVLDGDVASPAELAKAYMGSRPSKVSPSALGLRSQAVREEPTLQNSQSLLPKSSIMSIVPRPSSHGVLENGFTTPRSRGRSAIYNMARTPYSRVYPTSTLKGVVSMVDAYGGSSSSAQSAWDNNRLPGPKQGAIKRRSTMLENDIGSVGPIRRIRHKSNLLSSKGLSIPVSGSPLSTNGSRVGIDTAQYFHTKMSTENIDDTMPSTSFPPLPSKSREMGNKILQQLDKLVSPKDKSSEIKLPNVVDTSPTKLSPSMLRGQALQSLENVESSKFQGNLQDKSKLKSSVDNTYGAQNSYSQQRDKVENGQLKIGSPSESLANVETEVDATYPNKNIISITKTLDSSVMKPVNQPLLKKRAFHMSAHEDYLELDDDSFPNGSASSPSLEGKEKMDSTTVAEKTSITEAYSLDKPPALSLLQPSKSSALDEKTRLGPFGVPVVVEKSTLFTSLTASSPNEIVQPAVAIHSTLASEKATTPNESSSAFPILTAENKVQAMDAVPVSFADKVTSLTEPTFNFGSNKECDKVPESTFTSMSSVGGEHAGLKMDASSNANLGSSSSSSNVITGATDSMPRAPEAQKVYSNNISNSGFCFSTSETALQPAVSTSMAPSTTSTFSIKNTITIPNQNTASLASSPSLFSSAFQAPVPNNITSQNPLDSTSVTAGSSTTMTASSNGSAPTSAAAASNFGASQVPSTSFLPVSSTSVKDLVETKNRQDPGFSKVSGTIFGGSSVTVGSSGSSIFGFSSSAASTANNLSQGSAFGGPASPTGPATFTQNQFSSSAALPSFGLTQSTAFSSGSSLFTSVTSATELKSTAFSSGSSLFTSVTPATNIFNSGASFVVSTSASSSEANCVNSSSGTASSLFGGSWQPGKSPFGSTFSSSSLPSAFSFGAAGSSVVSTTSAPSVFGSSTGASSSSPFSFNSAAAATSTQPIFGNANHVSPIGSASLVNNNDQMNMEDSMAEDAIPASMPAGPVFGQAAVTPAANFGFGPNAPSGVSPFQFASQQNLPAAQNPSPFQPSGSLEFNAGGSFSLGSGGGDKSNRRYIRVKSKQRKK
ncbi:Nuclear pore complex protein NUP1 [Quillaja saponaria]|uniref:Nuclear pore complex protein NUP1 n=1 Tax=Quillaja saponaria TaxID=32244 RepID=A0AAD7VGB5_QUISA|nr:Nuclear pore complex protein NUP1 [Quillaja saponaria]